MSKTKNTGGPAFPVKTPTPGYNFEKTVHPGMTLRDHFAGLAMQGLVSTGAHAPSLYEQLAAKCYILADAMIKARDQ